MLKKRLILDKIDKFLSTDTNLLILGSRQVGKSTLLTLIAEQLVNQNFVSADRILRFDLEKGDDLVYLSGKSVDQLSAQFYARAAMPQTEKLFVFIDEIQYLPQASSIIKALADHYPSIRLFLTGSSSLEIKQLFSDRLTGRKVTFQLSSLTFREYLDFQEHPLAKSLSMVSPAQFLTSSGIDLSAHQALLPELLPAWEDFVLAGGYPRPSLLANHSIRTELLAEVRDQYARKDVRDLLHIENVPGFNTLLSALAVQTGNLVNIAELTVTCRLSRETVDKYLFLLEETFIIKLLRPYFRNSRTELTKMPKVYFADTGLRNLLIAPQIPDSLTLRPDKGALVENAIFHELQALDFPLHYWRNKTKSEVDFIVQPSDSDTVPIEVKYQSLDRPTIPSGLVSFITAHRPKHAIVVTKDFLGETNCDSTKVIFIPAVFW